MLIAGLACSAACDDKKSSDDSSESDDDDSKEKKKKKKEKSDSYEVKDDPDAGGIALPLCTGCASPKPTLMTTQPEDVKNAKGDKFAEYKYNYSLEDGMAPGDRVGMKTTLAKAFDTVNKKNGFDCELQPGNDGVICKKGGKSWTAQFGFSSGVEVKLAIPCGKKRPGDRVCNL